MSTPISGPGSPAAGTNTTPRLPPAPWYVPFVGLVSVLFGPSIIALNWWLVTPSIKRLEDLGAGPASTTTLWVSIWSLSMVGAFCLLSGIGLLLQQKWGRWMSFVFLGVAFVGLLIAGCATKISANLAELEIAENGGNFVGPTYVQYVGGVPAFAPLYGLVLLVVLNLRRARSWARGGRPEVAYVPAPVAEGATGPQPSSYVPTQLSTLALLSLVISMVPFMLLTQCAALVMGIMALRRIKSSQGRLTGRGFAIAGICISSSILLCIGSIVTLALSFYALSESSLRLGKSPELQEARRFSLGEQGRATQLEFSPDGSLLMCRAAESGVRVWELSTGDDLWSSPCPDGDLVFSPDSKEIASVSTDGPTLVARDARTGAETRRARLAGDNLEVRAVALQWGSPGLVAACGFQNVQIWRMDTGEAWANWALPKDADETVDQGSGLAFMAEGNRLLVAATHGLYLCESQTGEVVQKHTLDFFTGGRVLVTPSAEAAVVGGDAAHGASPIQVVDLEQGSISLFDGHRWGSQAIDMTPDGKYAVSGGRSPGDANYMVINGSEADYGCEAIVWKPSDRSVVVKSYAPEGSISAVAISPDGSQVAIAEGGGRIVLYDILQ